MASEAFIVGEAWLSEHYFTTDAKSQSFQARVLERRKQLDAQHDETGTSALTRFTAIRSAIEAYLASVDTSETANTDPSSVRDEYVTPLLTALGFTAPGLVRNHRGPVKWVRRLGIEGASPLALIEAKPADTHEQLLQRDAATLLEAYAPEADENHPIQSVARTLSSLFADANGPAFALVLAGQWLLLAENERWPEGRYLAIDLQLVCQRNETKKGGEIDRLLACVSADALAPDEEGDIWWSSVLDESVKHTVGVSQDLREGVRLSIEIIANDVVARRRRAGLEALPGDQAQVLAKQALRFLYRILFLLYAEASPELKVLPAGTAEYEQGYSLDRLRDLTLASLSTERAEHGTHLYESLAVLFRLVDQGHGVDTTAQADDEATDAPRELGEGLVFHSLRADLFLPKATALIDEVKLSDRELQRVLQHLLLSKEQRGRDRGFISYADLGINQLGAVYEGLMSYTGFFAEEQLHEVAKDGDASKGSWVVPVTRSGHLDEKDFVKRPHPVTGEPQRVVHEQGSFVFRLAGRERQQSASYYTPEVLTRFTVGQALEELLDQNGEVTTAEHILELTVCEPALGSGAFAIEAVRQLAEQYLTRRQSETGERIDPDAYPRELQKVKAYIALHNIYGVDLNATAVELAEVSLWLDTMAEDLQAPWFGLHLRRGNSLIGARRAVYSAAQVADKTWLNAVPRDIPLTELAGDLGEGRLGTGLNGGVHHFLLPAAGWGSAVEAKEARELAPERTKELKAWQRGITRKPTKKQLVALQGLAMRVERLWQFALRRYEIAESQVRRQIPLWGRDAEPMPAGERVTREEIEATLADPNGAVQRLRRAMDAWNALWFWPVADSLTQGLRPPTLDEWIAGLEALLGRHVQTSARLQARGQTTIDVGASWVSLGDAEQSDLGYAGAHMLIDVLEAYHWLRISASIAERQGFFHWELDFATAFSRGGFDLQVGNPPWVRPTFERSVEFAEFDPWWQLAVKPSQEEVESRAALLRSEAGVLNSTLASLVDLQSQAAFFRSRSLFPILGGLQPDLYRCFMMQVWRVSSPRGVSALLHPDSHFTDDDANMLREYTYKRLRRHWQFKNELRLFEIGHTRVYSINVYSSLQDPRFLHATSLFHPDTVEQSLRHSGIGEPPGIRTEDGSWDRRPHASRIALVDAQTLSTWNLLGGGRPQDDGNPKMIYLVNRTLEAVVAKLALGPRIGDMDVQFSTGWHEKADRAKGAFDSAWGRPVSIDKVVLQGPHMQVANPYFKYPNSSMRNAQDWSEVDLIKLSEDEVHVSSYKVNEQAGSPRYFSESSEGLSREYSVCWRNMADNAQQRTLMPAIYPPGIKHIHGVTSLFLPNESSLLPAVAGMLASIVLDFIVRITPKSTISGNTVAKLPAPNRVLLDELALRTLRLNCLSSHYAALWSRGFSPTFREDQWTSPVVESTSRPLGDVSKDWSIATALRSDLERRQALVEIDALVCVMLQITQDEMVEVFRGQFGVLRNQDAATVYDRGSGMSIVRHSRGSGGAETPQVLALDREADMRQAHSHFERLLRERS